MKHKIRNNSIFVGIMIILLAVGLLLSSAGIIPGNATTILFTVVMAAIAVRSAISLNFTCTFFGIAHLVHLYRGYLLIPDQLPSWLLILGGVLIGVGFDLIFKGPKKALKRKKMQDYGFRSDDGDGVTIDVNCTVDEDTVESSSAFKSNDNKCETPLSGNKFHIENSFGTQTRYIKSDSFESAHIENGFGTLTVYFDDTTLGSNPADLHLENGLGTMNVYFPSDWKLELHEENGLGEIKVIGQPSNEPDAPLIRIHAENGLGNIQLFFN